MKKGEAKIEFFSNINFLKKEFQKGLVISKFLYEKAKNKKNIKMSYQQFNKYFNDIFKNTHNQTKTHQISTNNDKIYIDTKNNTKDEKSPIMIKIDTKNKKIFNPNKNISKKDIL